MWFAISRYVYCQLPKKFTDISAWLCAIVSCSTWHRVVRASFLKTLIIYFNLKIVWKCFTLRYFQCIHSALHHEVDNSTSRVLSELRSTSIPAVILPTVFSGNRCGVSGRSAGRERERNRWRDQKGLRMIWDTLYHNSVMAGVTIAALKGRAWLKDKESERDNRECQPEVH